MIIDVIKMDNSIDTWEDVAIDMPVNGTLVILSQGPEDEGDQATQTEKIYAAGWWLEATVIRGEANAEQS